MKITIITVCYNRKATIEKAIQSVLSQNYPDIEYIIIDGNSKDGTQEIIESYKDRISKYISEPDKGMYDAINKGFQLATGDVIGLMHSDDEFYDRKAISRIAARFENDNTIDGVYGDGIYVSNDKEERLIRDRIGGVFSLKRVKKGWLPLHPTVYLKKAVIDKHGLYNLDFKIASDTEFLLRYLYKHKINMSYIDAYIVKMRMGGMSTSLKRAFEVLYEDYKIYKFHGLAAIFVVFLKKSIALRQYIVH
ncbi:glycosyltransferase [Flavobacterium sp. CF108]|uniref:glycosyltransferase family 2 protein n=1 Tax=unclassified Flavobacterium TaxID=196869 RepID=UPI0006ABBA9D|nr:MULTISPECIES: glycosyltransferase family 2 protein [unclassified Flavobacterium]KOP39973.1 glycosyl transferase [Flavobacterium sp. VMW]OWU88494.1 glycosyl transferase [Flavobacterium sp. NLM]PUU69284.1 glycosyltransferase [Flavobacterium sp. WLB]SEN99186.1 glycosyltransferase [Flavobacterium sp. fv08]SHH34120.1 glycosyltransferase [Flavobacterium sp. CF108]